VQTIRKKEQSILSSIVTKNKEEIAKKRAKHYIKIRANLLNIAQGIKVGALNGGQIIEMR